MKMVCNICRKEMGYGPAEGLVVVCNECTEKVALGVYFYEKIHGSIGVGFSDRFVTELCKLAPYIDRCSARDIFFALNFKYWHVVLSPAVVSGGEQTAGAVPDSWVDNSWDKNLEPEAEKIFLELKENKSYRKIECIKQVRNALGVGLRESKHIVEALEKKHNIHTPFVER